MKGFKLKRIKDFEKAEELGVEKVFMCGKKYFRLDPKDFASQRLEHTNLH